MPATDRPTRFAADLLDAAAVEGRRESRSAKQQLDYWARLGRAVSMHQTAARRRIEAALSGECELADLSPAEQLVANSELDIKFHAAGDAASFGPQLAAEGITTVALDERGNLIEHRPDGTEEVLAPSGGAG